MSNLVKETLIDGSVIYSLYNYQRGDSFKIVKENNEELYFSKSDDLLNEIFTKNQEELDHSKCFMQSLLKN